MSYWNQKKVLVTGGLGFLGSNLAIRLVEEGAYVTIVDAMIDFLGGNEFNIAPIARHPNLRVNISNVCDKESIEYLVKGQDHILHLAAQVSHVLGQTNPSPDIDWNIKGTATLLEACKKNNPQARILYSGTRGQYGKAIKNPITEEHSLNPLGLHEMTKVMVEQMLLEYHKRHNIKSVLTRITNVYGPRAQMKSDKYCVANWFIRKAIDDETIQLHGGGDYRRDFLFVDDCVDDLLKLAATSDSYGDVYNVGNMSICSFADLAREIVATANSGKIEATPFTEERKKNEPGDIYLDTSKLARTIAITPRTSLREGLEKTIAYYKEHKKHYWP